MFVSPQNATSRRRGRTTDAQRPLSALAWTALKDARLVPSALSTANPLPLFISNQKGVGGFTTAFAFWLTASHKAWGNHKGKPFNHETSGI